jgi:nifR3 family TIM-barrel protein
VARDLPELRVGGVEVENGLVMAPTAGCSKVPQRLLAKRYGCGLAFCEMVKAHPLVRGNRESRALLRTDSCERPVGAQIAGGEPEVMAEAVRILEAEHEFDVIDINMGCPVKKVFREECGVALMALPAKARAVIDAVCRAARRTPITLKMRTGIDGATRNAVEIARMAEDCGVAAIAVHGRTRAQGHSGPVDLETIAAVKRAVSVPVIGNGGIHCPEDALRMLDRTGCDGLLVARGAFGAPWIFRDIAHYLRTGELLPPPPYEEIGAMMLWHHAETVAEMGERGGNCVFRRYAAWYLKGAPGVRRFREAAIRCETSGQFRALIGGWIDELRAGRVVDDAAAAVA